MSSSLASVSRIGGLKSDDVVEAKSVSNLHEKGGKGEVLTDKLDRPQNEVETHQQGFSPSEAGKKRSKRRRVCEHLRRPESRKASQRREGAFAWYWKRSGR